MKSSLSNKQIITKEDVAQRNKELQQKAFDEGGLYFMKKDVDNMNWQLKLENQKYMQRILNAKE